MIILDITFSKFDHVKFSMSFTFLYVHVDNQTDWTVKKNGASPTLLRAGIFNHREPIGEGDMNERLSLTVFEIQHGLKFLLEITGFVLNQIGFISTSSAILCFAGFYPCSSLIFHYLVLDCHWTLYFTPVSADRLC